jgi:hypothetical protein
MPDDSRFATVLAAIEEGASLRAACRAVGMSTSTWYDATDSDEALALRYARARERCLAAWADDIIYIADSCEPSADAIAHAKVAIDSRKWTLAKLMPNKYGDRVAVDNTHRIEMTPEQMDARIAELQRALALSDAAGTARIARREGADQEPGQDQ